MPNITDQLTAAFATFTEENRKFDKGNNSAGTRARKALQEIKVLAQERRNEITATKNAGGSAESEDKDPSEAAE